MTTTQNTHVVIAGGGIAGIAAALALSERGARVTLLETRKKLGGRATSFTDQRSGQVLDNCQHVMLGCCTNYADLLRRLDAQASITWYDEQYWIEEGGRTSLIRPGPLPAPAHFGLSMLRARFLSPRDLAQIGRAAAAILTTDRADHARDTFGAFLARHGQGPAVVRRFWEPVVVSACNMAVDRVSASVALHVFQEGFFANRRAAAMGVPSVPLVALYDRAERRILASGGLLRLGVSVTAITARSVTIEDGGHTETLHADRIICALPVERVNKVVDAGLRASDPRFAPLDAFTHSPILGVHLTFDRPVLPYPHAVLVDRPTQWLFSRHASAHDTALAPASNGSTQTLHAVISAADDWMPLTEQQITDRVLADIHACLPSSRGASLLSSRPVKEKRATFAPTPGVEALRPTALPPGAPPDDPSLILAGDYTDTGWPATMEGATRSGYTAAAAALGLEPSAFLVPPLPIAAIPRALAPG